MNPVLWMLAGAGLLIVLEVLFLVAVSWAVANADDPYVTEE